MAKSVILSSDPNYFICDCLYNTCSSRNWYILLVLLFSMFTSEMVLIS